MIFDIIRSSFVDGPGIRTAVFFKGCNLKCAWCHNPESQSPKKQMMFYANKCVGCGKCKEICPYELKKCDFCGKCETYCLYDARKICGKEMTADKLLAEIVKDKMFYEASGGGVTFSGGECMLQIDFLAEILQKCKENGIHTAVDTAGFVPFEYFEKILPHTDLFLYDVKAITNSLHKEFTGVSNELILENLKKLSAVFNGKIIVRIPVIDGVNATIDEITAIAEFISKINISKAELLPYHAMGEHKYSALGKSCTVFTVPSKEDMTIFEQIMEKELSR